MDRRPTRHGRRPYLYNYNSLSPYPEIQEMLKLCLISIISVLLPSHRFMTKEQFEDVLRHSSFQFSVLFEDQEDILTFSSQNQYRGNYIQNVNRGLFRQHLYYLDQSGQALVPNNTPLSRRSSARVPEYPPIRRSNQSIDSDGSLSLNLELGNSQSEIRFVTSDNTSSEPLEGFLSVVEDIVIEDEINTEDSSNLPLINQQQLVPEVVNNEQSVTDLSNEILNDSPNNNENDLIIELETLESSEIDSGTHESDVEMDDIKRVEFESRCSSQSNIEIMDKQSVSDSMSITSDNVEVDRILEEISSVNDLFDRGIISEDDMNNRINVLRSSFSDSLGKTSVLNKMLGINKDETHKNKMFYHNKRNEDKLRFRNSHKSLHYVSDLRVGRHPDYRSKVTNFFSKYVERRLSNFKSKSQNLVNYNISLERNFSYIKIHSHGSSIYDMYCLNSLVKDIRYKFSLV